MDGQNDGTGRDGTGRDGTGREALGLQRGGAAPPIPHPLPVQRVFRRTQLPVCDVAKMKLGLEHRECVAMAKLDARSSLTSINLAHGNAQRMRSGEIACTILIDVDKFCSWKCATLAFWRSWMRDPH